MGGRLTLSPLLPTLLAASPPQWVIAADGGARHAAALEVGVDLWVGDFDSSAGHEVNAPREVHPTAKNQTDGELAIELARKRGATELVILGAFGGRFDHTAALALGAVALARQGLRVTLSSGDEWGWPLLPTQPLSLELPVGYTLSIVACSDLTGLSASGLRWPLAGATVPLGSGWTVSNETLGGKVEVSLEAGYGLVTALTSTEVR